jgi:hypothetical protein
MRFEGALDRYCDGPYSIISRRFRIQSGPSMWYPRSRSVDISTALHVHMTSCTVEAMDSTELSSAGGPGFAGH